MGTKNNPAPNDCYERLEPDEPYFTLAARDKTAPATIMAWVRLRRKAGKADWKQDAEAIRCADAMERWRKQNRTDPLPPPRKPPTFNDHERAVFNVMSYGHGGFDAEEFFRGFRSFSAETGLDRSQVRLACRSLARKGLARYQRGLFNDDGECAGSGYGITREGVELAAVWLAALPFCMWDYP